MEASGLLNKKYERNCKARFQQQHHAIASQIWVASLTATPQGLEAIRYKQAP